MLRPPLKYWIELVLLEAEQPLSSSAIKRRLLNYGASVPYGRVDWCCDSLEKMGVLRNVAGNYWLRSRTLDRRLTVASEPSGHGGPLAHLFRR